MGNKRSVVAILPDGSEHFYDLVAYTSDGRLRPEDYADVCRRAVREAGLTPPRREPAPVAVQLFALEIEAGQLKRRLLGVRLVEPPLERMTEQEFDDEMDRQLRPLPAEFHPFVRQTVWERGHSSGYEEVVGLARELIDALAPAVEAYAARVGRAQA